jgi:hypothetical protein
MLVTLCLCFLQLRDSAAPLLRPALQADKGIESLELEPAFDISKKYRAAVQENALELFR